MENIIIGNVRVQLLSDNTVRIEYANNGRFCDKKTFFIPNRANYESVSVAYAQEKNVICFGAYELYIPENAKSLSGIRLEKCGKKVYTYKKLKNTGELPPLDKTPEVFAITDAPRIIVPDGGYSVNRKGEYTVEENVQDVYILLCGGDAKKLRQLYVELTGRNELVRLSTLGGWNSKYYAYSEDEAKQLILDYEKHAVPLDVMVIDTDWRSCENGWGYDINEKLFPDMKRFMDFAHAHGVEIMFNDHPEPVDGAHVFESEEIAYREKNLQSLMNVGLDGWWYDRNWGTHLISPTPDIYWESLGLYLFDEVTRHYWQNVGGDKDVYRRPVIMGNVVNILNGIYGSITDSASHRYSIQWTGDIGSGTDSLAQEIRNLIKCGNNCIPYANADCGGHLGNPDKELFIRWMQFGTMSPVFRPHCTNYVKRFREPWAYDRETLDIVREYNNLRYRLLPVIYKNAYNNYLSGEPIFKSLGFEYAEDKKAEKLDGEYMLGNDIIIAPIVGYDPSPIPQDSYASPVKAVFFDGMEWKGEPIGKTEWNKLFMDLRQASPLNGVPVYNFSARFETTVKFDKPYRLFLRTDDGATVYVDGKKVLEDKTMHAAMMFPLCDLTPNEEHKVIIDYFQAGGEAFCGLYGEEIRDEDKKQVYLPKDKWLNPFSGEIYSGGNTVDKKYALHEMPIFIRLGALLPLAYNAHNTKEQKWNRLVLDYYSDKMASDSGYIYEDDTETTAYKLGKNRTTIYTAKYCKSCNAYIINLEKPQGEFDGDKSFTEREITVKRHVLGGECAARATVNGKEVDVKRVNKASRLFPINTTDGAPDGECELITFTASVEKTYEIKFFI